MMSLEWDIIYWDGEHTTDYVPSIWSNDAKTEYKLPSGPRMTESKKRALIYTCAPLEKDTYIWYKATCKKRQVTSLEKAKSYCRKSMVTSNLESDDSSLESSDNEFYQPAQFVSLKKSMNRKNNTVKAYANEIMEIPILDMPISLVDGSYSFNKPSSSKKVINSQKNTVVNLSEVSTCDLPVSEILLNNPPEVLTLTDLPCHSSPSNVSEGSLPLLSTVSTSSLEMKVDIILQKCNELKFTSIQLAQIEKRMEKIEDTLKYVIERDLLTHNNCNAPESHKKMIINLLPFDSVESLQENETHLVNNESIRQSLEDILFLVGGESFHKSVYNMMKKLISPELALMYSGQGKKKKLAFCNLKIYGVITAAVRRRYPDVADTSIQKSVSLFLASAKDRLPKADANSIT